MRNKYAVVKGKALTMIRAFVKVYPNYDIEDLQERIVEEVMFASKSVFNDNDYELCKLMEICIEVKEIVDARSSISGSNTDRAEKQEELPTDLHQSENAQTVR